MVVLTPTGKRYFNEHDLSNLHPFTDELPASVSPRNLVPCFPLEIHWSAMVGVSKYFLIESVKNLIY